MAVGTLWRCRVLNRLPLRQKPLDKLEDDMAIKSPQDLLTQEIKEIHSAERQLSRALPKLAKAVRSEKLREMLQRRREQGAILIEALDEALEEMQVSKGRVKNVAIEGLIEDANQHVDEINDEKMLDAALIGAVQKVEHYCIAAWGTTRSMGQMFGQQKVVEAMERALEEGKRYDLEMTQLAESEVNPAMLDSGEGEEEDTGSSKKSSGKKK
jgi:ferritin-like metal-binding protein YciE